MEPKKSETMSDLLYTLTRKSEWALASLRCAERYMKIFDDEVVGRMREEFLKQEPDSEHTFDLCIGLLRATAQGTVHKKCPMEEWPRLCRACITNARNIGDLGNDEDSGDYAYDVDPCEHIHPKCRCTPPDYDLYSYIQYKSEHSVDYSKILSIINRMRETLPVDWHPGSDEMVRDIIHPSLYCLVKGRSKLSDGTTTEDVDDERERYLWLPSEFSVVDDKVELKSYINNFPEEFVGDIVPYVGELLSSFLPSLREIITFGDRLQVIVKIASIHLNEDKPQYGGGSWHIEGVPAERIVATCINYLEMKGINNSFLEFRTPLGERGLTPAACLH